MAYVDVCVSRCLKDELARADVCMCVYMCVCVCVCVCVCPPLSLLITIGMMWHDMDPNYNDFRLLVRYTTKKQII